MILVTTSRRADPLVRRVGRDLAFAIGGRYVTRGKGGLSQSPFSEGTVLILCRDGKGMRIQVRRGMREAASLRFLAVREERRKGPLKKGILTGDADLLLHLSPYLPLRKDEESPGTLFLDGIQGRRLVLEVGP